MNMVVRSKDFGKKKSEMNFAAFKKTVLQKTDKSVKGSWDKPIQQLCDTINDQKEMVTLSSCSGRICLLEMPKKYQKNKAHWLIKTHEKADPKEFLNALKNYKGKNNVYFRSEPPILHVAVASLNTAKKLLQNAQQAGFKKSGIISLGDKIVVEIASTESLIAPVFDKKMIITENYLKYLIEEGNTKREVGWKKIKSLFDMFDSS